MGPAIASLVQSPFAFPFGATNPQYAFQQQAAAFPQAGYLLEKYNKFDYFEKKRKMILIN